MKKRNAKIKPTPIKSEGGCCDSKPALQVEENKISTSCCEPKAKKLVKANPVTSGCCG